jgi:hypothetical protein
MIQRHNRLKKKAFGEVAKALTSKAESGGKEFNKHLKNYIMLRNEVVHHFYETYSNELRSGDKQAIVVDLASRAMKLQSLAQDMQKLVKVATEIMLRNDSIAS